MLLNFKMSLLLNSANVDLFLLSFKFALISDFHALLLKINIANMSWLFGMNKNAPIPDAPQVF